MRPRIALLGRVAERTSVTRHEGIVTTRALAESIWQAGGEPLTLFPHSNSDWSQRLRGFSGVLMPGGGDIDPGLYGQEVESDQVYGVNAFQDAEDLSLTRYAVEAKIPFLAVCRGMQLVNVAFGGTLVQHMTNDHRNVYNDITIDSDVDRLGLSLSTISSSCFHHQAIDRLGEGLRVIARAAQGHPEAIAIDNGAWAYGVQWHPEDNASTDKNQAEIFSRFVEEARAVDTTS